MPSGFFFSVAIAIAKNRGGTNSIVAYLQILLGAKANNAYSRYEFAGICFYFKALQKTGQADLFFRVKIHNPAVPSNTSVAGSGI